jgi:hypothetical protein
MARDPVSIVDEFLLSIDQRVRQNALAALAAIGSEASLRKLADTAIDGDYAPRYDALSQILYGAPPVAEKVAPMVEAALRDPVRRIGAYTVLGGLRKIGVAVQTPRLPWRTRWDLARSLRFSAGQLGVEHYRTRTLFNTIAACVLGVAMMELCLLVNRMYLDGNNVLQVLLPACAAAAILAVTTASQFVPVTLTPDRSMALLIYGALTGGIGVALGAIAFILLLFVDFSKVSIASGLVFILGPPVAAIAIAGGTYVTAGAANSKLDIWIRSAAGGVAGFLAFTGVVSIAGAADNDNVGALWIISAPVAFGAAAHLASLDHAHRRRSSSLLVPRVTAAAILAIFCFLVILPVITITAPSENTFSTIPTSSKDTLGYGAWQLPSKVRLVQKGSNATMIMIEKPDFLPFVQVELRKDGRPLKINPRQWYLQGDEGPAEFLVRYTGATPEQLQDVLKNLGNRIQADFVRARFGLGSPAGGYPVEVTLVFHQ